MVRRLSYTANGQSGSGEPVVEPGECDPTHRTVDTIMAGLTFGTLLTMLVVPAMYSAFYRVKTPQKTG